MAHAHPLADAVYLPSLPSLPRCFTPRQQDSTPHQRRLQLRNAAFRGPLLSAQRMSPFASSIAGAESFALSHPVDDENLPLTGKRQPVLSEQTSGSSVSILQEINNSSRRKRETPPRSLDLLIFQDSTATPGRRCAPSESGDTARPSPSAQATAPGNSTATMKLRELSLNEVTPPLKSPLARQLKGRKKSRINLRSASFEASNYIEHLESELAALNAKLDAITSPTATRAQAVKLRDLGSQLQSARRELADWEASFEERVTDRVFEQTEAGAGFRIRIRALEEEIAAKDVRLKEIEWELEAAQVKAKDASSLEATNRSLERRVDVLTELLALSPTRLDFSGSTPFARDAPTPAQRPKSMILPRIPSSPATPRLSNAQGSDASWRHKRSAVSTSSISENPELEDGSGVPMEQTNTTHKGHGPTRSASMESASDNATYQSAPSSSSRPTSLLSNSSFGAFPWGPALAPDDISKSISRSRKMRRFPSGACALKPLVLPTATTILPPFPASVPHNMMYETPSRDSTAEPIDPTTAFLSNLEETPPFSTPTQRPSRRSAIWAHQQALEALEGRLAYVSESEDQLPDDVEIPDNSPMLEGESGYGLEEHGDVSPRPTKRCSLQMELEQAEEIAGRVVETDPNEAEEEGDLCERVPIHPTSLANGHNIFNSRYANPVRDEPLHHSNSAPTDCTPMPLKFRATPPCPGKPRPASTAIPASTVGMFSRLTGLVSSMKHHPLVLAKKVILNTWMHGSSRFGGMSWWLLGLIFASRDRTSGFGASHKGGRKDVPNANGNPKRAPSQFDWGPYTAEASKRRRLDHWERCENRVIEKHSIQLAPYDAMTTRQTSSKILASADALDRPSSNPGWSVYECEDCVRPASNGSLKLWGKFFLAIILAIGVAVREGPEAVLEGLSPPPNSHPLRSEEDQPGDCELDNASDGSSARKLLHRNNGTPEQELSESGPLIRRYGDGADRLGGNNWGWELTFTENLTPAHFQA